MCASTSVNGWVPAEGKVIGSKTRKEKVKESSGESSSEDDGIGSGSSSSESSRSPTTKYSHKRPLVYVVASPC